jgi:hypothetical protein
MQKINVKEETFGISSSSTSREDHGARHKSRHLMNMTKNGPGIESWSWKLEGPRQKMLKLAWKGALYKPWRRRRQGPTCIREQVNNWPRSVGERNGAEPGRNGLGSVSPSRPAWPISGPVRDALWPRRSSIYCLCLRRPPYPSNHKRAADTKEKHREQADGRRKSSSCLGDGLGHALAAMAGPAWWSHGVVLEPWLEFVKSFVPSTFGDVIISCLSLIYYELCLFICVATICF